MSRDAAMDWFKCLNTRDPDMIRARQALGKSGMFEILQALEEAQEQRVWDIDIDTLCGWIGVKRDRAEKILPFAQKILSKSQKILSKSSKISENLEQISENLRKSKDFDPSNPRGSTRDLEENRIDKREENTPPNPLKGEASASPSPEKKPRSVKKIVPSDWQPPLTFRAWLSEKRPDVSEEELQAQIQKFKDNSLANGNAYLNFEAALRNWFLSPYYAPALKEKKQETEIYINPYCISNRVKPGHERIGGSGQW